MSDGSVTQEEVDRLLFPKKQREFIEIQEDILKEIGSMKYDNTSDLYFEQMRFSYFLSWK